jgi:hypothetical protein
MDIKEVKYYKLGDMISGIKMTLADDSVRYVPRSQGNTDYDEIKKQVDAGTLTIKDAD